VQLDGKGGYQPGKIAVDKTITLSPEQWTELQYRLETLGFWAMPTHGGRRVEDGDHLILEAVKGGKYQIVDQHSPDPNDSVDLCRFMLLDLAELDLRKTWDIYRE
jgi:hypothetical protein